MCGGLAFLSSCKRGLYGCKSTVARAKEGFIIPDQTRSNAIRLDNVSAVPASRHFRQQGSPAAASRFFYATTYGNDHRVLRNYSGDTEQKVDRFRNYKHHEPVSIYPHTGISASELPLGRSRVFLSINSSTSGNRKCCNKFRLYCYYLEVGNVPVIAQ